MVPDTEPSVHWAGLPNVKEIYTAWWFKLSSNWNTPKNPAGAGKMTFLFASQGGQVYTNLYYPSGAPSDPPYHIGINTEWAPYGQQIWLPNMTATPIYRDRWYRVEFYYKWETTPQSSMDGIVRWWVYDSVTQSLTLNGDYSNVHYPNSSFVEFQYAPTRQVQPAALEYLYIDHTRLSRRPIK